MAINERVQRWLKVDEDLCRCMNRAHNELIFQNSTGATMATT